MDKPQDLNDQNSSEHIFKPFPKPNTIPSGWDMSELSIVGGSNNDIHEKQKLLGLDRQEHYD